MSTDGASPMLECTDGARSAIYSVAEVFWSTGLSVCASIVFATLYVTNRVFSLDEIAHEVNISRSTLGRAVAELRASGFVETVPVVGSRKEHIQSVLRTQHPATLRHLVQNSFLNRLDENVRGLRQLNKRVPPRYRAQVKMLTETLVSLSDRIRGKSLAS